MMTSAIEAGVAGAIDRELGSLIELRRDLHRHPELGFEERRTSEIVQRELSSLGISFRAGLAGPRAGDDGTGVVAHLPATTANPGPCVALRADMDALPIHEETGRPYASEVEGVMHACGHDGHTAVLVGVARVLSQIERPNPVTLVFQPAEEGGAGGEKMIRDGALGGGGELGPAPTRIYALHGWTDLALGNVGTKPGPILAATDEFDITIRGAGGHAAFPHKTNDPIVTAAHLVTALQTIASRGTRPTDACVVTVGAIHGGGPHKVIPAEVTLRGTVRTLDADARAASERRVLEIARSIASAFGCEAEIEWNAGYPETFNDPDETARFTAIAREALGEERVLPKPEPSMGGEDFAFYAREIPACFFQLGLCPPGADPDAQPRLHQSTFDFNDEAIATGVAVMCRLATATER